MNKIFPTILNNFKMISRRGGLWDSTSIGEGSIWDGWARLSWNPRLNLGFKNSIPVISYYKLSRRWFFVFFHEFYHVVTVKCIIAHVSESDIERCANEDVGSQVGWIVKSHIGWRWERNIAYKSVETLATFLNCEVDSDT